MKKLVLLLLVTSFMFTIADFTTVAARPDIVLDDGGGGGSTTDTCNNTTLSLGYARSCHFEGSNDKDFLSFTTNSNTAYTISIYVEDPWDLDYFRVLDSSGSIKLSSGTQGVYNISLSPYSSYKIEIQGDTYAYSVKVEANPDTGGSSRSDSVSYNVDSRVVEEFKLEQSGDQDYFKVYLKSSYTYFIASTGSTDVKLELLNSSGGVIETIVDSTYTTANHNFTYYFNPSVTGTYYLRVSGDSSSITGEYGIVAMKMEDLDDEYFETVSFENEEIIYQRVHTNPNQTEPETFSRTVTYSATFTATVTVEAEAGVLFAKTSVGGEFSISGSVEKSETVTWVIEAGYTKELFVSKSDYLTEGTLIYRDANGTIIYEKTIDARYTKDVIHTWSVPYLTP